MTSRLNPNISSGWSLSKTDLLLMEELREQLPSQIFGFHEHLYRLTDFSTAPLFLQNGPVVADGTVWKNAMADIFGAGKINDALFIPYPALNADVNSINNYVITEAYKLRQYALVVATPNDDYEKVKELLKNKCVRGFKPYHIYSNKKPTFQARITDFCPEWIWRLADENELIILLHIVKDNALADEENQREIRYFCESYPRAKLVLAHAVRGFHSPNTVKWIHKIADLQNIWYDVAAICESEAITAILEAVGPRHLLWGSDFPVSHQRGRCVTLGSGFAWITADQVQWNDKAFFGQPSLVIIESLRAVINAANSLGLNSDDMADLFYNNAIKLLGITNESDNDFTQTLYTRAKKVIPGGTQLLSKRPEMFAPNQWPAYYREARGCEIWDLDGRHYYDFSIHGIGSCLLGFRDPHVTRAVKRRLNIGSFSTLNSPDEIVLYDLLCDLHPWAEQVRYARSGGEGMAMAVRIARATTDRSAVAICGYHGWHDWYLAANLGENDALRGHLLPGLNPIGVPRELRGTAFTFGYNDKNAFQRIISEQGHRLAAIVMEPCRYHDPETGFLEFVRDMAHKAGALLIFDEITIGWRLVCGGAHMRFKVIPDIAVFAKAMGNGHPIAAILGTKSAMEGANLSFISSTYWTEGVGLAAAIATIEKMRSIDVPAHCEKIGKKIEKAWREIGAENKLPIKVDDGYGALAHFVFEHPLADELKTLYVQEMLARGFLAGTAFYPTLSHTESITDHYINAINDVFSVIKTAIENRNIKQMLKGPVAHKGFQRLL